MSRNFKKLLSNAGFIYFSPEEKIHYFFLVYIYKLKGTLQFEKLKFSLQIMDVTRILMILTKMLQMSRR